MNMGLEQTKRAATFATWTVCGAILIAASSLLSSASPAADQRPAPPDRIDYTHFSHATPAHRRTCSSCHTFPSANWKQVRKADAAFPDVTEFPQHASCLECHRKQFFARERPAPSICSVCHVAVTPRFTARKPFPNPLAVFRASKASKGTGEFARGTDEFVSDFRVSFPHSIHLEQFGEAGNGESCATCHETYQPQGKGEEYVAPPPKDLGEGYWLKKGTFKTVPDSHETCFTCHAQEGSPVDCATCHKLAAPTAQTDFDPARAAVMGADGIMLERGRRRHSSGTFRHEGGMHADVGCATCHDVAKMDTADDRTTKVSAASCATCHVTDTTDDGGAMNYEIDKRRADAAFRCEKCHFAFSGEAVPAAHVDLLPKPKAGGK
jgi:hypothetical protein